MRKYISILLTALLLMSSSGISYAQHFCGGYEMMSEVTLGEKHLSCGMQTDAPGCDEESGDHDCCDNEYTSVDTDDNYAKANFNIAFDDTFVAAFVSVFVIQKNVDSVALQPAYPKYFSPPIERDFLILYETFLI